MLKQKRIPILGEIVDALYTSLPVLSILNFFSITIVLYSSIQPYLKDVVPWLTFPLYLLLIFIAVVVLMVLIYKFVLPSLWTFRAEQMNFKEKESK